MSHRQIQQQAARQTREQELEAQASALLRAHAGPKVTAEYPFYISESSMRQAATREKVLGEHGFFGASREQAGWTPLLEALCDHVDL
ncbi:MAG: hypothetical protein ACM3VW_06635, partial [Bacteroidota bacterium]